MKNVPVERIIQVDYETGEEVGRYVTIRQAAEDNFISVQKLYNALNKSNGYLHNEKLCFKYSKNTGESTNEEVKLRSIEIAEADVESTCCEISSQLTYEFNKNISHSTVAMWITEKQRNLIGYVDSKLTVYDIKTAFELLDKVKSYRKTAKEGMKINYRALEQIKGLPSEVIKSGVIIEVCRNFVRTKEECVMYRDIVALRQV